MMTRKFWMIMLTAGMICYASAYAPAADNGAVCVNFDPADAPALTAAAQQAGLQPSRGDLKGPLGGPAVFLQVNGSIGEDQAARLGEYVRTGGSLLVSLGEKPGKGPMCIAYMLPTIGWNTARRGSMQLETASADFATTADVAGFGVPYYFEIRPFLAAERGQGRYNRYDRPNPYIQYTQPGANKETIPADSYWWSRPLINRDWQVQATGSDLEHSPLLLTGRYGAGKVAVFASSVTTPQTEQAVAFWKAAVLFLQQKTVGTKNGNIKLPSPQIKADVQKHALQIAFANSTQQDQPLQYVVRLMTWEQAIIGDRQGTITIEGGKQATVEIPLPQPGPASYQALEYKDAYHVRVGVLSDDGSTLLAETAADIDLRPMVGLTLETDELRAREYPYEAPDPSEPHRLGLHVSTYAYKPSETMHLGVTLENGLRNLAPMAQIEDLTTPDNASVSALNDLSARGERGPDWFATNAYGQWSGDGKQTNELEFTFPQPVTVANVVLYGSPDTYRFYYARNPEELTVLAGGNVLASDFSLKDRFMEENGRVRINFAPTTTDKILLRVKGSPRWGLWLGEVEMLGSAQPVTKTETGRLSIVMHNDLAKTSATIATRDVSVKPFESVRLRLPVTLPDGKDARFLRFEAIYDGSQGTSQSRSEPVLVIDPERPLKDFSKITDGSIDLGFIVTRGFRNVFDTAVGTARIIGGWGQPDDLVWAYEHGFKQMGGNARPQPGKLYVSPNDMRHYSTPWRQFYNGEEFYDVATPLLVERAKEHRNWNKSDLVHLSHSDRWDTGPSVETMNSWQDFIGFDQWLREQGKPGMTGRTRKELSAEVRENYESEFYTWNLQRYVNDIRNLREAFAQEGKKLLITAQGAPILPLDAAQEICKVIRGMNDDNTWGLIEESIPLTTGRQMGMMAMNPYLDMKAQNAWGWDSAILGNAQWRGPVSTTEPSRRHIYDRAFRGTIRADGTYTSMHVFGYGLNGGIAYTMNANDYEQWARAQEKHSLLTPSSPIGAGLVVSTAPLSTPGSTSFSCGGGFELKEARKVAFANWRLQQAGMSIAFSANAASLANWQGNAPLVILNIQDFGESELDSLNKLAARGIKLIAFSYDQKIPQKAADLFGVDEDGNLTDGKNLSDIDGRTIAMKDGNILVPIDAEELTAAQARDIAPMLIAALNQRILFPEGASGYGFTSNGRSFIVIEDWMEQGRTVMISLKASDGAKSLAAIDTNTGKALNVSRDNDNWSIELPIRPGDGSLICFEEKF